MTSESSVISACGDPFTLEKKPVVVKTKQTFLVPALSEEFKVKIELRSAELAEKERIRLEKEKAEKDKKAAEDEAVRLKNAEAWNQKFAQHPQAALYGNGTYGNQHVKTWYGVPVGKPAVEHFVPKHTPGFPPEPGYVQPDIVDSAAMPGLPPTVQNSLAIYNTEHPLTYFG